MEQGKISVIVPIYNVEAYLAECVDSILAQTYRNFECILVDDGSTDASGRIADDYREADSRVRVIHKKNGGLSDARNAGIDAAVGEYLAFVDSDDWVGSEMLEKQMEAMEQYDAQIAASTMEIRPEISDWPVYHHPEHGVYVADGKTAMLMVMEERGEETGIKCWWGWSACGKLFRAELFRNQRFSFGKRYEDLMLVPYLFFDSAKVVVMDDGMYNYRIRAASIMQPKNARIHPDIVEAVEKMVNYAKEHHMDMDKITVWSVYHMYTYFCQQKRLHPELNAKDPFVHALRGYLTRHYFEILFCREAEQMAKVRFAELLLFNSIRLPFREEEKKLQNV